MSCQRGHINVVPRRSAAETVIHILDWPSRTQPYVTSSACLDRRTLQESWSAGDQHAIGLRRGNRDGDRKGRVLYFLDRGLGDAQRAFAAGIIHVPERGPFTLYRLCYTLGIDDLWATFARHQLLSATHEAANAAGRPGIVWRTPKRTVGEMMREQPSFRRISDERDEAQLRLR
jgi:hypothetical protein